MIVYIATKWENRQAAADLAERLERNSESTYVTRKWWNDKETINADVAPEIAAQKFPGIARLDMRGVEDADVFILLATEEFGPMRGALVELGIALVSSLIVYVVGELPQNVFFYHPRIEHVTIEQVIKSLT